MNVIIYKETIYPLKELLSFIGNQLLTINKITNTKSRIRKKYI